jgi:hypothetical protein
MREDHEVVRVSDEITVTRKVNGNHAIRVGDDLRDLLDLNVGDYVTIEVRAVHKRGGER